MKKQLSLHRCLLATVALLVICLPCFGQGNLRTVLFVKVKLDQEDNWKASVKDYVSLVKKAGAEHGFTVWESQTGPHQWAIVWYSEKFKDIGQDDPKLKDSAADLATLFARLNGQTDSLEYWIDEMQPDLMIRGQSIPPYVRTGRSRIVPGKMEEMRALFRDEILPAYKKAGTTDYGVAVGRFGTPTNEFHSYLGVNAWADFDGPIGAEKGMSASEWKAFQTKVGTLVESTQWDLWKFHPELSYVLPQK
ncbi:MAG TPA: hypothetical protein VGS27_09465 [Candidatus Sulfotelmatobacter sp.]|nr:hypothetical protein [Candidatus Sulfotelmatobacter sp.]